MPWQLSSPGGLWLLALVAPLVLLYLLKAKRRRVVVQSTVLWARAQRELSARRPLHRLQMQLPLLLQLAALAALALALAHPTTQSGRPSASRLALVMDVSASMAAFANSENETRFDVAKRLAEAELEALPPGAEACIVAAAASPQVASPLLRDRSRLRSALAELEPLDVEADLEGAVVLASERVSSPGARGRVLVLTDGSERLPRLDRSRVETRVIDLGTPEDNVGIVGLDISRRSGAAGDNERVEVFAAIENFGRARRNLFVSLRQMAVDSLLDSRRLELDAGARVAAILSFAPAPGEVGTGLVVELSGHDAQPRDDRAFAVLPPPARMPVVLSPASASPWLRRALLADDGVELLGASIDDLAGSAVPPEALLVVEGACPKLPGRGDVILVDPPPGACLGLEVRADEEPLEISGWSATDPRLEHVSFDGVTIARARQLDLRSPPSALAWGPSGAVIADASTPARRVTVLSFDLGASSWPLTSSFVVFVHNLVELGRASSAQSRMGWRPGETVALTVPPGVDTVRWSRSGGEQALISARGGVLVVPPPGHSGLYLASYDGGQPGSQRVAVNLLSEDESDLRHHTTTAPPHEGDRRGVVSPARRLDHAPWLAALALAWMLSDLAWWSRRRRSAGIALASARDGGKA